jgi:hypothetical protein
MLQVSTNLTSRLVDGLILLTEANWKPQAHQSSKALFLKRVAPV